MKIDDTDRKILEILQEDGRITNAKLAATIGISPPAMLERVRRLETAGVISRYTSVLDREKIGLEVMAIVSISLALHQLESIDRFEEKLLALDEVLECHQVTGDDDFILKVVLEDIKSYSEFALKKLATIPGIQSFKSSIVLSTIKHSQRLPVKICDS